VVNSGWLLAVGRRDAGVVCAGWPAARRRVGRRRAGRRVRRVPAVV